MSKVLIPEFEVFANEDIVFTANFTSFPEVVAGQTLVTPTVPDVSGLTISGATVNAAAVTDHTGTVAIGKGVQARIRGFTAGTEYTVKFHCVLSGGGTRTRAVKLIAV